MYLTQLTTLLLLVVSQTSMSKRVDDVSTTLDMDQFDCVSTGEKWREFKTDVHSSTCQGNATTRARHSQTICCKSTWEAQEAQPSHQAIQETVRRCDGYSISGRSCSSEARTGYVCGPRRHGVVER